MTTKTVDVLIFTGSIVLQQALYALLESLPGITSVKTTGELANLPSCIESHQPRIVLLDIALSGNDPRPILEKIQRLSPQTRRILLVDQVEDMRWVPQYAEAIVLKGAPPSSVATIVTNLMLTKGDEDEHNDSHE